jgi:hypothetical protein
VVAGRQWRLATFLLLITAVEASGQRPESTPLPSWGKARPVDDARRDPTLASFRDSLLAIVARRDSVALSAHLSPTVIYNFGTSDGGPAGFFADWRGRMESLWRTLDDVLKHGGEVGADGLFWAPWTVSVRSDSIDVEGLFVVRDSGVAVYAKADSLSPTLGTLSFDIVKASGEVWDDRWAGIQLRDGRRGFVVSRHIRSPMQYRLALRREGNRWVIHLLLSGD